MDIHPSASYIRNFQITRETKGAFPQKRFHKSTSAQTDVHACNLLTAWLMARRNARERSTMPDQDFRHSFPTLISAVPRRFSTCVLSIDEKERERDRTSTSSNVEYHEFQFSSFSNVCNFNIVEEHESLIKRSGRNQREATTSRSRLILC